MKKIKNIAAWVLLFLGLSQAMCQPVQVQLQAPGIVFDFSEKAEQTSSEEKDDSRAADESILPTNTTPHYLSLPVEGVYCISPNTCKQAIKDPGRPPLFCVSWVPGYHTMVLG